MFIAKDNNNRVQDNLAKFLIVSFSKFLVEQASPVLQILMTIKAQFGCSSNAELEIIIKRNKIIQEHSAAKW